MLNSNKVKKKNMKKWLLFTPPLIIFFLLLIPVGLARLLNFTGQTPKELYEDDDWTFNGWMDKISAVYSTETKNWYVALSGTPQLLLYSRWDWNLSVNQQGWQSFSSQQVGHYAGISQLRDWNNTHVMLFYSNSSTGRYIRRILVDKEDITETSLHSDVDTDRCFHGEVCEQDYMMACINSSAPPQTLKFIDIDNNEYDALCPLCDLGNGGTGGIADLELIYVEDLDEYWMFAKVCPYSSCMRVGINESTPRVYMTRYSWDSDDNRFEPTGLYDYTQVSTYYVLGVNSEQVGGNEPSNLFGGSVNAKLVGDHIYVWIRESSGTVDPSNASTSLYIIDPIGYAQTNRLYSGEEIHNLEDYDPILNETIHPIGLGLGYNPELDDWYFFYQRFIGTQEEGGSGSKGYHSYALGSPQPCFVGDWYNVSYCGRYVSGYQLQFRTTSPAECDVHRRYVDCVEAPPIVRNRTVTESKEKCSDWRIPEEYGADTESVTITVDISEELSDYTTSIESTVTGWVEVEPRISILGGNINDNYTLRVCNPTWNCTSADYDCDDEYNTTLSKDYTYDVSLDDILTGYVEASHCTNCREMAIFNLDWYGWVEYRVCGVLTYDYTYTCGDRYVCIGEGEAEYSVPELDDCEPNMTARVLCPYGCNKITGLCFESEAEKEGIPDAEIRSPSGNPFEWIMGEAEFNLGTTITMFIAFGVSLGGGVYSLIITKKWQAMAITVMGLVALFMTIGWLPAVIGILWILSIALILMKGIFKGD